MRQRQSVLELDPKPAVPVATQASFSAPVHNNDLQLIPRHLGAANNNAVAVPGTNSLAAYSATVEQYRKLLEQHPTLKEDCEAQLRFLLNPRHHGLQAYTSPLSVLGVGPIPFLQQVMAGQAATTAPVENGGSSRNDDNENHANGHQLGYNNNRASPYPRNRPARAVGGYSGCAFSQAKSIFELDVDMV